MLAATCLQPISKEVYFGNPNQVKENILLYPNPSSGIINIQTNHTFTPSIKIYNLIGELVFSQDNLNPNNQISLQQPSGIYMVVAKSMNSTSTSKLIIK